MTDPAVNAATILAAVTLLAHVVQVVYTYRNIHRVGLNELGVLYQEFYERFGAQKGLALMIALGVVLVGFLAATTPDGVGNAVLLVVEVVALAISYKSVKRVKQMERNKGKDPKWGSE